MRRKITSMSPRERLVEHLTWSNFVYEYELMASSYHRKAIVDLLIEAGMTPTGRGDWITGPRTLDWILHQRESRVATFPKEHS